MSLFDSIELTPVVVGIDTEPLYEAISSGWNEMPSAYFLFEIYALWRRGSDVMLNDIAIQWDKDILERLTPLIAHKVRRLKRIRLEEEEEYIQLIKGLPKRLRCSVKLELTPPIDTQLIDKLEAISDDMGKGHYKIMWRTGRGEKRTCKPQRIE